MNRSSVVGVSGLVAPATASVIAFGVALMLVACSRDDDNASTGATTDSGAAQDGSPNEPTLGADAADGRDAADANGEDARDAADATSNAPLVTSSTTSVTLARNNGGAPTNDGAAPFSCGQPTASVVFDLVAKSFTYELCSATAAANRTGTVQLSTTDYDAALSSVQSMRATDVENCGEDIESTTVSASTGASTGASYENFTCNRATPTASNVDAVMDGFLGQIPVSCPWLSSCH